MKQKTHNIMLDITKVVVDADLYPRDGWSWQTSYGYSQAMLAGAKFPPIVVALNKGKYFLVDGRHRIEAVKILGKKSIETEVVTGWSRQQLFEEAVKRNLTHGKALTVHEKRVIALKLRNWKYAPNQISEIIQVPLDKLENFVAQRLVNAITGETIAEGGRKIESHMTPMIVKSGIKNAINSESVLNSEDLETMQHKVYSGSQQSLLRQLIGIIKAGLLDTKNKEVNKLIKQLKELI